MKLPSIWLTAILARVISKLVRSIPRPISKYILNTVLDPINFVEFAPPILVSPLGKWLAANSRGNPLLSDLGCSSSDVYLLLGAFQGNSILAFAEEFPGCRVLAFEPLPTAYDTAIQRCASLKNVTILPLAVSAKDEVISLYPRGDATSQAISPTNDTQSLSVMALGIDHVFRDYISDFEDVVFEVNIEGGEYSVLQQLLDSVNILRLRTLLIQFHNVDESSELTRSSIRARLRRTHRETFCFDWVWERWDRL